MRTSINHYSSNHEDISNTNPNLCANYYNMHNKSHTNENIFKRDQEL